MQYIDSLKGPDDGCFLCRYREQPDKDRENFVLWRRQHSFAMLNLFPYTSGHSMVAPLDHLGQLDELDVETMCEMMEMVRDLQCVLRAAVRAEGFNIGMNVGRCAGAGLPGHLHIHIVPRWSGDTNFMAVLGDIRIIPQSLEKLYAQLVEQGQSLGLPRLSQ